MKNRFLSFISALILFLFIVSFAVTLTLNFKPLYYFDMEHLKISQYSGYSEDEIRANYDVLIDYNNFWGPKTLDFPTLSMSETGRIHFEEVKVIFVAFEVICIITFLLSVASVFYHRKHRSWKYLKYTSVITIAIPVIIAVFIGLCWDKVFVIFHKIFFNNDYWIFSPVTDPVINILPDTFFMHCAIMIISVVVLGSIVCGITYKIKKRKFI